MSNKKYRRGDKHPTKSDQYFWGKTSRGGIWWVTEEQLATLRKQHAEWRANKYSKNKEKFRVEAKKRYHKDIEKSRAYQRSHYNKNIEHKRQDQRRRKRQYYASDPLTAIRCRLRSRLTRCLNRKSIPKTGRTRDTIGCSWEELMAHIESQFLDGMTWDNRSEWHIDHRIPLAAATTEEEVMKLCHYTNLQPMWGEDNLSKQDKHCPKELVAYLDSPLTLDP